MTVGSIPHPLHPSARLLPPKTSCKCLRPGSGSRSIPSMKSWNFKNDKSTRLMAYGRTLRNNLKSQLILTETKKKYLRTYSSLQVHRRS